MCGNCEDIYMMSPDGDSATIRLTDGGNAYSNTGGDWSHSKKLNAFQSNRSGRPQIFLMNFDGTGQQLLPSLGAPGAVFPSFSQSGNELCFGSQTMPRDIYIVNSLTLIRQISW